MGSLKFCPECHSEFKEDPGTDIQYCDVCGYWTRKETASLGSIMIYE
jgi:ribosomal protein L37AE/L43A